MKTILFLIFLVAAQLAASSQSLSNQVLASAGRYSVGSNASLESTTGEAVTPTLEANGLILTQGFHQPMFVGIPIYVNENNAEDIRAYPNPVSDLLTLSSSASLTGMALQIFDASGRLVYSSQLAGTSTSIQFSSVSDGLYLLQVLNISGEIHYQTKLTHVN